MKILLASLFLLASVSSMAGECETDCAKKAASCKEYVNVHKKQQGHYAAMSRSYFSRKSIKAKTAREECREATHFCKSLCD